MNNIDASDSHRLWILAVLLSAFLTACSSSVSPPGGAGVDYQTAKVMFKQGNLDRALSLTDNMASSDSNSPDALKARVLRAVIYSARIDAYRELSDTYQKGSQIATKAQPVTSFNRHRANDMQYGSEAALNLGEAIMKFTSQPEFPKEVTLDVPWPGVEGPQQIDALSRIGRGIWVPEDTQESAGIDAQHKALDDVLVELIGGDRSKAKAALEAGPVQISGLDFALFLEKNMVDGLELFGPKYLASPGQSKTLCDVADRLAAPIAAMLKEKPDKAKEASYKKLQDRIKDAKKFT